MTSYLVLLRGINVGGKNKISMTELKQCLENDGYEQVVTYINSGNLLLSSEQSPADIGPQIEQLLIKNFKLDSTLIKVLVLTYEQIETIVKQRPKSFGTQPENYHSDVIFLMGITVSEAIQVFRPREGVDRIWPGKGVIYSQRLSAQRTKSRLNAIMGTEAYKSMTIRNWNTTTKLLALMSERRG